MTEAINNCNSDSNYRVGKVIDKTETVQSAISYTKTAIQAGQVQKVIPAVTSAFSSDITQTIGKSLVIGGSVVGCIMHGLNIAQKNKFIEGLEALKKNEFLNQKEKDACIDLLKKEGNLDKILSSEFCKRENIHISIFFNTQGKFNRNIQKLDAMIEQAKKKRLMDFIGLIISLLSLTIFLASMATPVPIWLVQFLPTLLFIASYIIEKQFIDNTTRSLYHFIPDFIRNFNNQEQLLKIHNLSNIFEANNARFSSFLSQKDIDKFNKEMRDIRELMRRNQETSKIEQAKQKFSEKLREALQINIKKNTVEMTGLGFLASGGALALLPSPALLAIVLPLLAIGLVLKFKPNWAFNTLITDEKNKASSNKADHAFSAIKGAT